MHHRLLDLMDGQRVLSGAIPGRRLLSALIATTPSAGTPTLAFLDFEGVEVATASFLRESVIGFRDYARQTLPNIYPVVANLPAAVAEELDFFVRARGDVVLTCDLDGQGKVVVARLFGDLDPAQRTTFDAVREVGLSYDQPATDSGVASRRTGIVELGRRGHLTVLADPDA